MWDLIGPLASSVYFVPEVHSNYKKLGLAGFGSGRDDADELFDLLAPWTNAVLEAKGCPRDPASVGRT